MKNIHWFKLGFLSMLIALISLYSLMLGFSYYSISDVINCLFYKQYIFAIMDVRMPRLIMGILCGSMFALSSSLLQGIFRNHLASSETLGINASCTLSVLLGVTLCGGGNINILYYSIIGAIAGFLITLLASITNGKLSHLRLIVIGIAISALFRSASQFMLTQQDEKLAAYLAFLNGTLYSATWSGIHLIIYPALIALLLCFCCIKQLDALLLSDEVATSIGFNVDKWKVIIIVLALLLAAIAVAGVGSLGFIGLISPNISRLIFGYSYKYNLLGSALVGSGLTILSDIIGRVILIPFDIPSGLISILIGVPYFLYIMRTMR